MESEKLYWIEFEVDKSNQGVPPNQSHNHGSTLVTVRSDEKSSGHSCLLHPKPRSLRPPVSLESGADPLLHPAAVRPAAVHLPG